MRKMILALFLLLTVTTITAQSDSSRILMAFPITSYMVDLNDSVKLVQIVPGGLWEIKDKQFGLLKGISRSGEMDSAKRGWGSCQLIKGDYYYFAIHTEPDGPAIQAGDLLYTFQQIPPGNYIGRLTKLAAHYISLQRVTDENFFNRGDVFLDFDKQKENALLDSMVEDIHFTGKYYMENDTGMNRKIPSGKFKNMMMLETMTTIGRNDISDFLDYMLARSFLYAGNSWKVSEIFATWMVAGAPTVIKN